MIVLVVLGIPDSFPKENLEEFRTHLCGIVQGMNAREIRRPDEVNASFPRDRIQKGLGEKIIIFINDFSGKLEWEKRNKEKMIEASGMVAKRYFPRALVKVKVCPLGPEQMLWSSA